MSSPDECVLVLSTCPDAAIAERIARALVERRAAACVNIMPPALSVYAWQGAVQTATEQLLVIKTRRAAAGAVERLVRELHPYELPEIIAVPVVSGLSGYLRWIADSVDVPADA